MKCVKLLIFIFIIQVIFVGGCRLFIKPSPKTWPASKYKYSFLKSDKVYIHAFRTQDLLFLQKNTEFNFDFSKDSLIVYEKGFTKKFFSEYFEIHQFLSANDLNLYEYLYSGEFIKMTRFFSNEIQYEKVNIDGVVYLKNVNIRTKF